MTIESAAKKIYGAGKAIVSDAYDGTKKVGGDLSDLGGRVLGGAAQRGGEFARAASKNTKEAWRISARKLYEQGRLKYIHTSGSATFFDDKGALQTSLVSVAIPARIEGKRWRAPKTTKVWDLWGSDYPAILVELEDPNPNFEGEEAIRLTTHGMAHDALGASDVTWRMWMPGRFKIKIDVQGNVIEKPQGDMTAGDVVSMLADTVANESHGRLTVTHRDLFKALNLISQRSNTLERRWSILEERLKYNKNVVNKPEDVGGAWLSMVVIDRDEARDFVNAISDGRVTGWSSTLDHLDKVGHLRVYGSFANLLGEGQRMLPRPNDPTDSFRIPARVLLGSYQILKYINAVVDNDAQLGPIIKELATLVKTNQVKSLGIARQILIARGQGFDEIRRRIETATPKLIGQMGDKSDEVMAQLGNQMSGEIDANNFAPKSINPPNSPKNP